MKKEDLIKEINAFGIEGVDIAEDTKQTVDELKLIHKVGSAFSTENKQLVLALEELNAENSKLTATVNRLRKGDKAAAMPEVEFKKETYIFKFPRFRLPKSEPTTADAVAQRMDEAEIKECIKRGVLTIKEGGDNV
jgi:cell division protein FtsB